MSTVGFLNLPPRHEELRSTLERLGLEELVRRPVLGRENAEPPWVTLDPAEFFSVVDTGFHFTESRSPKEWTPWVITSDAVLANSRLENGLAGQTGVRGAIGGTFPFLDICGSSVFLPTPRRLLAITDGVAGFVLTEMERSGRPLDEAIREAQWRNVAPGNMTRHLHALAARERLALLASSVFGINLSAERILAEGFGQLDARDVAVACRLGYNIRLIGSVEAHEAGFEAWVRPCLLPAKYILAQARGGSEAAYMQCSDGSSHVFIGPGTSFEVSLRGMLRDHQLLLEKGTPGVGTFSPAKLIPSHRQVSGFYIRLTLVNQMSTLAQITNLFAAAGVEVRYIVQPDGDGVSRETPSGNTELVIFTAPVSDGVLHGTLEQVRADVKLAAIKACLRYES
ncbi:MAG TPA: hypothetical protein PLU72_12365 [Candidatus Ozemobacteraceae bacterium]|nr:hypothetical protein [Candidatus Ozemobacteraceae bacterium]